MKTRILALAAVAAAAAAWHSAAAAQTPRSPTLLTLTVEGQVAQAPDVAEVSSGVVTVAPTAATAMAENATRMAAVVAAVRKAGIAERDIQTSGLSLQPQYRYDNGKPPVMTGYQATNTVTLRIRAIAETGAVLDTLVKVGANQINGPTFRVDDTATALDKARRAAVATAQQRAELYAKATGMQVRRVVTMTEGQMIEPGPRPMMARMMADSAPAAPPTPVAPGEVALTIVLTTVFELE